MPPPNPSSSPSYSSYNKPHVFLHWRGMKKWSIGKRAPSLCNMIIRTKSSSAKLGFHMVGKLIGSYIDRSRRSTSTSQDCRSFNTQASTDAMHSRKDSPDPDLCSLSSTHAHNVSEYRHNVREIEGKLQGATMAMARSTSCPNPQSYVGDYHTQPVITNNIMFLNHLKWIGRRHSDAANLLGGISSYQQFHMPDRPDQAINMKGVPPFLKLGNSSSKNSSSSSSDCQFRNSTSEATNVSSFMGSPAMAKIKDTCSRILTTSTHKLENVELFGDLLVGNQFLARVNPTPIGVSSTAIAWRNSTPSSGLLDANLKHRSSELKDRLIFFV